MKISENFPKYFNKTPNYEIFGVVPKQTKIVPKRIKFFRKNYMVIPILSAISDGGTETDNHGAETKKLEPKTPKLEVPKKVPKRVATKWTINPLNFTTSYYYPTPYTPHPILLRTFVYKYTSGITPRLVWCEKL